ncbi:MAG: molybdopterin-dependent oxidoreductase [Desulfarculaceae bacterium]|nr:molybdopterin-dependent oxidoreductase [Desulfarculaceae bacterium]MCF8072535.1 molybdopterin-dependent oxidoreductase [Desulfarculaceae bacterium]MCF8103438.1 molybdopterin-dependent oxidoreductase [Desulfarculaceae bacterium]MCF8117076.1 molybdopterin-dependent oxidoreductase [Desulfarculaceae bacterium]
MDGKKAPNVSGVDSPGRRTVSSICGMCAVRCPIQVEVEDGRVVWIQGNPNDKGMGTSLCAKGAAGIALEYDDERPQYPLIRTGPRGSGQWRRASWDEALDYIADKLKDVIGKYGGKGVALSDRGGPFNDLHKTFLKSLGSPNYFNHDCTCGRNTHHAAKSLFGMGRKDWGMDIKNTKHLVLFGRNMIESLQVKEAKDFIAAMSKGAKCTYIDVRATLTASKASRFWMIRPNTEYALNLAWIHVVLAENLYDADFVSKWVVGLDELESFVQEYTPEWAEKVTGVPAEEIKAAIREIAADAPQVIFHAGWMTARHRQSFHVSRTSHILNALMGNFEVSGGLIAAKGPGDYDLPGINKLEDRAPKAEDPRVDGVGTKFKHFDSGPGLFHLFFPALESGDPYQVGAYFAYRHDPLTSLPDPDAMQKAMDKLDLLVSIDVNYSETAWYADVILPEATYLERGSLVAQKKGGKPSLQVRDQCIAPRLDARPAWWIFREILRRLDKSEALEFETLEDIWRYQLEGTGVSLDELREKGVIGLADKAIMRDRDSGLGFKTGSGKVEIISPVLTEAGLPSLAPFHEPPAKKPGQFSLVFGRVGWLAHGQSTNNPLLNELMPENALWINDKVAAELGISDGDTIKVASDGAEAVGKVKLTEFIHPEAAFMVHGFGRTVPLQTRAYKKGMADQRLMKGMLTSYDPAGGGNTLTETVVTVTKA